MTDLAAAVAASTSADLLPARHVGGAHDPGGPYRLVDALLVEGRGAALAVIAAATDLLCVPGVVLDGAFRRAPIAAAALRAPSSGAFRVDVFAGSPRSDVETAIDVDQSNESVIVGDEIVVKWQVRLVGTPMGERLRTIARAEHEGLIAPGSLTPRPRAVIDWTDPSTGRPLILGTASDYLPGTTDGWTWAVELVRAHVANTAFAGASPDAVETFGHLGAMVADLHRCLASDGVQMWRHREIERLHRDASRDLAEAIAAMDGVEGARLRARATAIAADLDELRGLSSTPAIHIHGDLHVGQVLRGPDGRLSIIDFDGNPVDEPATRFARHPAARDVASMLASIDHVGRVVNRRTPRVDRNAVLDWIPAAQAAFLQEYRSACIRHGISHLLDDRLLRPLMLQQECREYRYAAAHLPHWRYVPDAVLTELYPDA